MITTDRDHDAKLSLLTELLWELRMIQESTLHNPHPSLLLMLQREHQDVKQQIATLRQELKEGTPA